MSEIQVVLSATVAVLCFIIPFGAAYLHHRKMKRLDREWRKRNPEDAALRDFYTGAKWPPELVAKMNADMRNVAPLQFNRTNIAYPEDPANGEDHRG